MDQRKTLASIRARTLVIVGSQDVATPPSHGQAIAAGIPGARVVELVAAHLSNIEALAYGVIGGAGPTDFYARTVGATVIPDSVPGIYADPLRRKE